MIQPNLLFFEHKPLFGLDITSGTVRVVQLRPTKRLPELIGYGEINFDPSAISNGVIQQPEVIAAAVLELFKHHLVGHITTRRVAMSLPIARAFTRSIETPNLNDTELAEAVQTESEQYIPAALEELYIDYGRVGGRGKVDSAFIVAMPKAIVDSYLMLSRLLGLETVIMQTASGAGAHLFAEDKQSDIPPVLVDLGVDSADITVYDDGPVVSGTVACGSEQLVEAIIHELKVTYSEAALIRSKYGLGFNKKQKQIQTALAPSLNLLLKELKRTIRYYEEHTAGKRIIAQVVVLGEGANMPGLTDFLTDNLRMAVRSLDPSPYVQFGKLQPFNPNARMSYVTAVGLASLEPGEAFS